MAGTDKSTETHDASRREFFRTFSRQTVQNAGSLFGAAAELRRTSLAAAREIFDGSPTVVIDSPATPEAEAEAGAAEWTFRSPYRFTGDEIVLLDQRELPGRVTMLSLREPTEIASAMRTGVITAGPVLAELGAYAMVLAAQDAAQRSRAGRQQIAQAAAGALRGARRDVQALAAAVERMAARHDALVDEDLPSSEVVAIMHRTADEIASAAMVAMASIGRAGAALVDRPTESPIQLLYHGDSGPLSGGAIGMGTAVLHALTDAGRAVHVWVTEGGPGTEGARITSYQLTQADIAHTVIPDAAIGWLFNGRLLDAVFLRADRACVNGDTGTLIGSLAVAQLAHDAAVPVYFLAPTTAFDASASDGAAIRVRLGSAAEVMAAKRAADAETRPASFGVRLNPPVDIVPAGLVRGYVTETGVLTPPFAGLT
jgi:methylthioribose-1-phosphate isomerase